MRKWVVGTIPSRVGAFLGSGPFAAAPEHAPIHSQSSVDIARLTSSRQIANYFDCRVVCAASFGITMRGKFHSKTGRLCMQVGGGVESRPDYYVCAPATFSWGACSASTTFLDT